MAKVKVSQGQVALAAHMIIGIAQGSGETGISELIDTYSLKESEARAWATEHGFLYDDGEGISLAVLPSLWAHFKRSSWVCLAFHRALQALVEVEKGVNFVAEWQDQCEKELARSAAA